MQKTSLFYLAWVASLGAVSGSLFFSEVLAFEPCVLCWYQRVFMFPLVLILGLGFYRNEQRIATVYSLPFALIGMGIAFYHNLLFYGVIPKALSPCKATGPSCTEDHLGLYGIISIPLLSFLAFAFVFVLLVWIQLKKDRNS